MSPFGFDSQAEFSDIKRLAVPAGGKQTNP